MLPAQFTCSAQPAGWGNNSLIRTTASWVSLLHVISIMRGVSVWIIQWMHYVYFFSLNVYLEMWGLCWDLIVILNLAAKKKKSQYSFSIYLLLIMYRIPAEQLPAKWTLSKFLHIIISEGIMSTAASSEQRRAKLTGKEVLWKCNFWGYVFYIFFLF